MGLSSVSCAFSGAFFGLTCAIFDPDGIQGRQISLIRWIAKTVGNCEPRDTGALQRIIARITHHCSFDRKPHSFQSWLKPDCCRPHISIEPQALTNAASDTVFHLTEVLLEIDSCEPFTLFKSWVSRHSRRSCRPPLNTRLILRLGSTRCDRSRQAS